MSPLSVLSFLSFIYLSHSACVSNKDCLNEVCEFGMCFPAVNLTDECSFPSQCQLLDENAFCIEGVCQCLAGFTDLGVPCAASPDVIEPEYPGDDDDSVTTPTDRSDRNTPPQPRPWPRIGETTTSKPECYFDSQCPDGLFCSYSNFQCMREVQIYDYCTQNEQCSHATRFTECANNHCFCFSGMYYNGTDCVYDGTSYSHTNNRVYTLITAYLPLIVSVVMVGIGLTIFHFVRRHKRRVATREFREKNSHLFQQSQYVEAGEAGPLPPKVAISETSTHNPDAIPRY